MFLSKGNHVPFKRLLVPLSWLDTPWPYSWAICLEESTISTAAGNPVYCGDPRFVHNNETPQRLISIAVEQLQTLEVRNRLCRLSIVSKYSRKAESSKRHSLFFQFCSANSYIKGDYLKLLYLNLRQSFHLKVSIHGFY